MRGREPADIAGALAAMDGRMYGNHGAKAAIEIALHDLAGRAAGKPVHALLGDKKRSRLPLLGVIGGGDLDGDLRDAEKKKAAGFTAYKIKVGIDTPENDAARTRAICKVLGSGLLISADANQGFSTDAGRRLCARGRRLRPRFLRAAGRRPTISPAWRRSPPRPGIAIGADEGIHSLDDIARHHERKAARGVSLKAIKLGGVARRGRSRPAVRHARHERQHLLQDRRIERRLRRGAARRVRDPEHRLGPDADPQRACAKTSPRSRCRPSAATPTRSTAPASASRSTRTACAATALPVIRSGTRYPHNFGTMLHCRRRRPASGTIAPLEH